MYRILIVEDDATIAGVLQSTLQGWGYTAECVQDFEDVMGHFGRFAPQLVLLDLSLPFRGGYHWCTEIRKISAVPVVFISSTADNMSMVTALHQGGDDFVAKPFDLQVLVAKIQALLRRTYDFAGETDALAHRGAVLSRSEGTLLVNGARVDLTRNELRILELLMAAKGNVVSRDDIMRRLWDDESYVDDNTLTVNVTRLRKKLADAGLDDFIVTKKGMGYLVPNEENT